MGKIKNSFILVTSDRGYVAFMVEIETEKKDKTILKFKSRKIDPKNYIFEKIAKEYENISWILDRNGKFKTENYDITDSIALAKASFKKFYEKEY